MRTLKSRVVELAQRDVSDEQYRKWVEYEVDCHMQRDRYAKLVIDGQESYSGLLQPATARAYLMRQGTCVEDLVADANTRDVITSMNQIGVANIDPDLFTYEGVRERLQQASNGAVHAAGVLSLVITILYCNPVEGTLPLRETAIVATGFTGLATMFSEVNQRLTRSDISKQVSRLEEVANATDQYIQRYIRSG